MAQLVEQTIEVYRGEAVRLSFAMTPTANITGWTLRFTVTSKANITTKILGPLAMTINDGPNGLFSIDLAEEQTDIKPATNRFDVWRTDEALEKPVAIGDFVVIGNSRVPPTE